MPAQRKNVRRIQKAKSQTKNKTWLWLLLLVVFVVIGLAVLSHSDSLEIQTVRAEGNKLTPIETIQELAFSEMKGAYLGLFSKSNTLIFPKEKVSAAVLNGVNRIESVELKKENKNSLLLTVKERSPSSLWCNESSTTTQCYFIDEEGYVYAKAPHFSGGVYFIYYGNIGAADPLGSYYTEKDEFHSIGEFIEALKEINLNPVSYSILPDGERSVELKAIDTSRQLSGSILYKEGDSKETVFSNLLSVLSHTTFKNTVLNPEPDAEGNIPPVEHIDLEYIDLRFGNKVFFKLKE